MAHMEELLKNLERNLNEETKEAKQEGQIALKNYIQNLNRILMESQKSMESGLSLTLHRVKRMFWMVNISWLLIVIALIFASFIAKPIREAQLNRIAENQVLINQQENTLKEAQKAGIEIIQENGKHYLILPRNRDLSHPADMDSGERVWMVIGRN